MLVIVSLVMIWRLAIASADLHSGYTNQWVARIEGGQPIAERIAHQLAFTFKREMRGLEDHYIMTRDDLPDVSSSGSHFLTRRLRSQTEVKWVEQQKLYRTSDLEGKPGQNILKSFLENDEVTKREQLNLENLGKFSTRPHRDYLKKTKGPTIHFGLVSKKISAYNLTFNDELWPKQWYFHDYRTEDGPVLDHNVVPVYRMNITGEGIVVGVVDTGVQHGVPDLAENYIESKSYDYITKKKGSDPGNTFKKVSAELVEKVENHGTNSAGVIAMVANNKRCGVGVAYRAKIIGIKADRAPSIDSQTSEGLVHELDVVDIYTNSWGYDDNGKDLITVKPLSARSIEVGITKGRRGKGAVYVFAAGNSRQTDHCASDETVSNPNIIVVAAANQFGKPSAYSERCAAVLTTAYSGCFHDFERIVTLNKDGRCSTSYDGTSASAPIISGILALALQANKKLTYRDVQHLVTMSSEVAPLANNPSSTWIKNGAGFWVNNDFGFGLLNAENIVLNALKWKNVPPKITCKVHSKLKKPLYFDVSEAVYKDISSNDCQLLAETNINYLEHVELSSHIEHVYRGALQISLISPSGTRSVMMEPRVSDYAKGSLNYFSITSTHFWGENPTGTWFVEVNAKYTLSGVWAIYDQIIHHVKRTFNGHSKPFMYHQNGFVFGFTLKFHGTTARPHNIPRTYAGFRLPNGRTDLT